MPPHPIVSTEILVVLPSIQLVRSPVWNKNRRVVAFEPTHDETVGLRPWWAKEKATPSQIKSRGDECWQHLLRVKRSIKYQQREIFGRFRTVYHRDGKGVEAFTVEVSSRGIRMVVRNGLPSSSVARLHPLNLARATAVFVRRDPVPRMSSEPLLKDPLVLRR